MSPSQSLSITSTPHTATAERTATATDEQLQNIQISVRRSSVPTPYRVQRRATLESSQHRPAHWDSRPDPGMPAPSRYRHLQRQSECCPRSSYPISHALVEAKTINPRKSETSMGFILCFLRDYVKSFSLYGQRNITCFSCRNATNSEEVHSPSISITARLHIP